MTLPKFSDKYLHRNAHDAKSVNEALEALQLSGTASLVGDYERALANKFGATYAIAVSSGSTAIQAALAAVGAIDGAEVLLPAIAPLPTVFPVSLNRAIPVPVDVRPNSLDFDPDDLRRKINSQTRAALVVPLWGYPINLDESLAILTTAGIPLIEDAAHAHGSRFRDRCVGTTGAMGCFSTHDRKLISTGEGGFILTSDSILAEIVHSYSRLGNLGGFRIGANYKFNSLGAALGISRLKDLDHLIQKRRSTALVFLESLRPLPLQELSYPENSVPNYYNLVMLIKGASEIARLSLRELFDKGIPIDQIKYGFDVFYRRLAYSHIIAHCPNAEDLVSRLLQLPVHPCIDEEDIVDMIEVISEVLA
jgi:perosamine synthetase